MALSLDREIFIDAPLEAGEFFYGFTCALATVKCKKCRNIRWVVLGESTCDPDEWGVDYSEDCSTYESRSKCPKCGSIHFMGILVRWYNNKVRTEKHRTRNCNFVANRGVVPMSQRVAGVL
ncbi:MAG: hypothetical protein M1151_05580 [Candidatus Thermoplasmatota archaeon]|nr:hypothetical protein [Candidatus Thermoplasmatota archaeon]MCL5786118.1 hypothetical protein [Candidatus Thermoplasmatota archaeon]